MILRYLHGYLKKNYSFDRVLYRDELLEESKEIKETPLTKEDICGAIKEIDNYIDDDGIEIFGRKLTKEDKYSIFTEDNLKKYLEESIDFIMKRIT